MRSPIGVLFRIVFLGLIFPAAGFAQAAFVDPGIPDNESLLYTATQDKESYPLTQVITRHDENGKLFYEATTESAREDSKLRIDAARMAVVYSWTRNKKPDLVVENETKIIKNDVPDKPGEVSLADFSGLAVLLRGFPFGKTNSLKVKSAQGGDFGLTVTMTGETDVKTKASVIPCYQLEFGMDGLLGAFFPKTIFWYAKAAPHMLVRFQGQTAGPGSPNYTIELAQLPAK